MIDKTRFRSNRTAFERHVQRFAQVCEVRGDTPTLVSHENAVYFPGGRNGIPYSGAVLKADGGAVLHGVLSRGGLPISRSDFEEPAARGGSALYLGWLFRPYGHLLLESLGRAWATRQVAYDTVLFHRPTTREMPGYARTLLADAGVNLSILSMPTVPTGFDVIHVPEPLFEIRRSAHRALMQTYAKVIGEPKPDPRPAYVSRSRVVKGKRTVIGEYALEKILEKNGFRIIHPQEMSVAEQVSAFRSHDTYVGMIGSAMHNILFAQQKPRVIYLTPGLPSFNYLLCDELVDAQSLYVDCCTRAAKQQDGIVRLDLAAALAALGTEGFVNPCDVTDAQKIIDREFEQYAGGMVDDSADRT